MGKNPVLNINRRRTRAIANARSVTLRSDLKKLNNVHFPTIQNAALSERTRNAFKRMAIRMGHFGRKLERIIKQSTRRSS